MLTEVLAEGKSLFWTGGLTQEELRYKAKPFCQIWRQPLSPQK